MEAKFGQTEQAGNFFTAVHTLVILFGSFAVAFSDNRAAGFAVLSAVLILLLVIFVNYKGKIIADENGITFIRTFFGVKVRKKFIEYDQIQGTDCGVNAIGVRGTATTRYAMEFTLRMKDGSKIVLLSTMNIGTSFPATEPEKYKKYLHEQPLMKISHYIDGKLHLNASA